MEWFNVSEPLSFSKHLKGKIVVLDFFTYCCINCMHIIPELRELEKEFSVEDGLVVVIKLNNLLYNKLKGLLFRSVYTVLSLKMKNYHQTFWQLFKDTTSDILSLTITNRKCGKTVMYIAGLHFYC